MEFWTKIIAPKKHNKSQNCWNIPREKLDFCWLSISETKNSKIVIKGMEDGGCLLSLHILAMSG